MKFQRVLLLMVLCAPVYLQGLSQSTIGRQKVDQFPTTAWNTLTYGLTWLPTDYDSTTTRYPLILFLHGSGEGGDGISGLNTLITQALPMAIANGFNPQAINPADGKTYKFIVVSPQAPSAMHWSYGYSAIQYILPDVISRYRIDTTRIYVTGLSAGGSGTYSTVTNGPDFARKIAAIVPICAAGTNSQSEFDQLPLIGGTYGVKVWTPCGANDSWLSFAQNTVNTINNATPAPLVPAVVTAIPGVGHEPAAWNTAYDSSWRSNVHNLNVYEWMLQYNRPSGAPTAIAGADQTITLPLNHVTVSGSGASANGIRQYGWTKISGPSSDTIVSPSSSTTNITGLTQGAYVYRLTVTDSSNATAYDDVSITVNAMTNTPPMVNAGTDVTITLPVDSTVLTGAATDADGSISSFRWKSVSGPSQYLLADSTSASTALKNLVQGIYLFELTVSDNNGAIARDTVAIIVNPAANIVPIANAGGDRSISLPLDSVLLNGSGTDADGYIVSYRWKKISGPSGGNIADTTAAGTRALNLISGTYQFQLTVTDNDGAIDSDTIQVVVNPAPVVNNCNGVKRYMIPADDGGRYINSVQGSGWYQEVNPGDTLVLKSQYSWNYFSIEGYSGTASCPIVITNEGGQVWLTSGISANNCKYLKITGSGNAGTYYGFKVFNPAVDQNGVAVCITGKARVIEVDRVDVYKKTYGVWAKQDPLCDTSYNYPNHIMDSIEIHHSRFKNIGQDCIYAGNTDPLGTRTYYCDGVPHNFIPMRLSNINIHHLIIDSCNRTGIQLGGANSGYNQIHDNLVTRCGYEYNQWQGTGIAIGGMTRNCHVYNNTVKNTFLYGIMSFGVGTNYIENNTVDSTGYLDGQPNLGSHPANILASPKETIPFDSTTVIIKNNKLGINSTVEDYNIQVVTWGPATWTVHNVVCSNTKLNGTTAASVYVDPTIIYQNNCGTSLNKMPPVARAGNDISLVQGADSTALNGTGSDPDGTIISYKWTLVSGPSQFTISQPALAQTTVKDLLPGTYVFRLTVMDNDSLTATDDVEISIPAPNLAPLANAGANRWITLPVNFITMTAGGYDPDGTITGYQWTLVSGPSTYAMASSTDPLTTVTNLVQGIYKFELLVTDNNGATGRDTMVIYVNPASPSNNIPPVAYAGSDAVITLPTNAVQLNGSGADADGSVVSFQWVKVSGPASYQLTNPTLAQTTVTGLVQGTYAFELTVTDNQGAIGRDTMIITVNPAPNQPPVVVAGADQSIILPVDTVVLSGSGYDNDGAVISYQWKKISGPASYLIVTPASEQTIIRNLVSGIYLFELTATDNAGGTGRDTVRVSVYPASSGGNIPPMVSAGIDQSITLPINSVTVTGTATDADGTIVSWQWAKLSGPSSFTIVSSTQAQTVINSLSEGVYLFELVVTDNNGATARDTVSITVNAALNIPPVSNAGADQTITLPINSVTLNGSGNDTDGTITSWQWRRISGPVFYSFSNSSSATTTVSGLIQGNYLFELKVTDNLGGVGRDTVMITVRPASNNQRPVARAGTNMNIYLPDNSVQVNGSGTDVDGSVVSYSWTRLSGPATYNIASPSQPQTIINNLVEGEYTFELKVTDDLGAIGTDTLTITVLRDSRGNSSASIYPNPGTSTLNLKIDAVTHRNQTLIRIYDTRGAMVYEEEFLRTQQVLMKQIDVSSYEPGVYFVTVGVEINKNLTLKFIKQ